MCNRRSLLSVFVRRSLYCSLPLCGWYSLQAQAGDSPQQVEPVSSELFCQWSRQQKKATAQAAEPQPASGPKVKIGRILIDPQPIFPPADDNIWLHDLANWAHVTTQPGTIERELTLKSGELADAADLAEAERLLRDKSYLRDARVRFSPTCNADQSQDVIVTSWDNWSLLPTFGFGRSGGQNKSTLGFKEDNFLGLGVRTSLRYQSDADRSGYEIKTMLPLALTGLADWQPTWFDHSYLSAEWTNNDDGHLGQLVLDKPFYQDDTPWMYRFEWLTDVQQTQVRHNGALENTFSTDHRKLELQVGRLLSFADQTSWRLIGGILAEDWLFAPPDPALQALWQEGLFSSGFTAALPLDRSWRYPFVGFEYKEHAYQVLSDILFIDKAEDVNFGAQYNVRLGVQSSRLADDASLGYRLQASGSKGFGDAHHLWLLSGNLDYLNGLQDGDFRQLKLAAEQYWRLSDKLTWYNKAALTWQNRNLLDQPLELGGDSGLRGYPLQYQHGTRLQLLTTELRFYPRINLYKLADLGFVAFADVGRASGGTVYQASGGTSYQANGLVPLGFHSQPGSQIQPGFQGQPALGQQSLTGMGGLIAASAGGFCASGPCLQSLNPAAGIAASRTQADLLAPNLADKWLGSVGIGARIYSSRSSNDHVVHIDLSTPLTSAPGVDSWEISLKVSNRF